jgi:hypothetical protein
MQFWLRLKALIVELRALFLSSCARLILKTWNILVYLLSLFWTGAFVPLANQLVEVQDYWNTLLMFFTSICLALIQIVRYHSIFYSLNRSCLHNEMTHNPPAWFEKKWKLKLICTKWFLYSETYNFYIVCN